MSRVFDCVLFHNEICLLEIRLEELYQHVNRFIIAEALETHSGDPWQSHYLTEWKRFKPFAGKITHLLVTHLEGDTTMDRQAYQRECMFLALSGCRDDDLIMISDVDEIPRAKKIAEFSLEDERCVGQFEQEMYYYYLNGYVDKRWPGTAITTLAFLRDSLNGSMQALRLYGHPDCGDPDRVQRILDGGWHFSLFGGPKRIREKVQSYGAQQFNREEFIDTDRIEECIEQGVDMLGMYPGRVVNYVPIDDTFPMAVQMNPDHYRAVIRQEA